MDIWETDITTVDTQLIVIQFVLEAVKALLRQIVIAVMIASVKHAIILMNALFIVLSVLQMQRKSVD